MFFLFMFFGVALCLQLFVDFGLIRHAWKMECLIVNVGFCELSCVCVCGVGVLLVFGGFIVY